MSKPKINSLLIGIPLLAIAIIGIVVLGAAMIACGSAGGTLSSGRSVMTYSDSVSLSSTFSSDTATIETSGKKILVQPTSLIVDGTIVANIDNDVVDVHVNVKRGVVTFVADGIPVETLLR